MIHVTVTRPGIAERSAIVADTFDLLDFAEISVRLLAPELDKTAAAEIDKQLGDVEKQRVWTCSPSATLAISEPEFVFSWRDYADAPAALPLAA